MLKTFVLKAPPTCDTISKLEAQIKKVAQTPQCHKVCLMIHEVPSSQQDNYGRYVTPYLVFAPMDISGKVIEGADVASLLLPCPPVCHDVKPDTLAVIFDDI